MTCMTTISCLLAISLELGLDESLGKKAGLDEERSAGMVYIACWTVGRVDEIVFCY